MKAILVLALATVLLTSCASFPGFAWDADLYNKSPVVLRVDIIPGQEDLRRHRHFPVRVLKVYKNTTDLDIPETLELASSAAWGGLPSCGKCTVYARQNTSKRKSAPDLALIEPSGVYIHKHTPAYSHHVFPDNSPLTGLPVTEDEPAQTPATDDGQPEPEAAKQEEEKADSNPVPESESDPDPEPESPDTQTSGDE